jgi:hypothetical protein
MNRRHGFDGREPGASRRFPRTRRCFPISKPWSSRQVAGQESPLRWTCKSVRRLAQALQAQGHEVSRTLVAHLLNEAGYSLQGNRKTTERDSHPDRDAQFRLHQHPSVHRFGQFNVDAAEGGAFGIGLASLSELVRFAFVDDNAVNLTVTDRKSPDLPDD